MIFALVTSVYAVLLDVNVQSMLARSGAGLLSKMFDTEVKIRTFYIKPDLRIHAEDIQMNDNRNDTVFFVGTLDGKFSLRDLKIPTRIRSLSVDDFFVNIVKYENERNYNLTEIFGGGDRQKNDNSAKSIYVDDLKLTNGRVVVWNQNKAQKRSDGMDYYHIDVDDINLSLRELSYTGDTVTGYFDRLTASEKSGFKIDEFVSNSKFIVSSRTLDFKNLVVKSQATSLDLNLKFLYNGYSDYKKFVDSITIVANIRPSQLTLSDLSSFSPTLRKMPDTLQINGSIVGKVSDFEASYFYFSFKDSTNFEGSIKMKGLPKFHETHMFGEIEKMNFTYQDISEFAIPTQYGKIPLPENLASIKHALISGKFYGFHNNFRTNFNLHTNIGNINFNGAINNDLNIVPYPYYYSSIYANNLNLKEIFDLKDDLRATLFFDMKGEGISKEDAEIQIECDIERLEFQDKKFENIHVDGDFENQRLMVSSDVYSDMVDLNLAAMLDVSDKIPEYDVELNLANIDLYNIGLVKKKMSLSTEIEAQLKGLDIDGMYGDVRLHNTVLNENGDSYVMDSLNLSLTKNEHDSKDVKLNCDFLDMDVVGVVNFRGIGNTFKNYVLNYFHISQWAEKGVRLEEQQQDFYVNLKLKDTETLSRLLLPELAVSDNTNLTATFTSNTRQLFSTIESDKLTYNGIVLNDLYIRNKTTQDNLSVSVDIEELLFKEAKEKDQASFGVDNVRLDFAAHNDSLLMDFSWNDNSEEDSNKGKLSASFFHEGYKSGTLHLSSSDVVVNDTVWNVSQGSNIYIKNNKVSFNDIGLYSNNQYIGISGFFPNTSKDTLNLNFRKLNISNFDILLASSIGVDVDGVINGNLQVSGIKDKIAILSDLDILDVGINEHAVGDAYIDANWNAADTSMFVDTKIVREDTNDTLMTLVGNYYTMRKYNDLDFGLYLNDMDISVVNAFAKGVLSKVEGEVSGDFRINGSLKKPVLTGEAILRNGACNIDYLNTYYRVNPDGYSSSFRPYIKSYENRIELSDIILVDTANNYAVASGYITHDYLKDFDFNIDAVLNNFIAMNMPEKDNASFYGTAVASGDLKINGPLDDIKMDINALTMPGTVIDIGLTSTSSLNDRFIIFVNNDIAQDTVEMLLPETKKDKKFTFNLNADITSDASLNIVLPSDMGNINASGSGNIRLGYDAMNKLSLFGDYVIDKGSFIFNFQNLVRREFDIKKGGTISWTGKANDADINVVGSYRTKSSISSLGLEIDSTSLINNINVDCILRLQEKLNNPSITFGLSLPNATDDVVNTVFSVIDTTNQAVMSQQIISLLVLGSFSYSNASLYSIGATNYYNLLTSSISNWLSQISKDFDIGVRYTPEGNLTAEEYEVALSYQPFGDRLMIEGNFGMYTESQNKPNGASNFVGDFDLTFKVTNKLSLKMYNHSNLNSNYYTYSYEAYSPYTQGLGFSYSQSFDSIKDLFTRNKKNKKSNKRNKHE